MFKNKIHFLFLIFWFVGFSQNKKTTDTIFVYEEVIVHDTVYIEKPLDKIKLNKIIINPAKKGKKPQVTIFQNNKKGTIVVDTLVVEPNRKPFAKNWEFGAKVLAGFNSNSLFKEFNYNYQLNFGLGVFVKKTLFHHNFAIGIGFEASFINSTFTLTATTKSFLNGYYFTNDRNPKLFNSLTNKGLQFQIPVQLYWKIKKFTPSVGIIGTVNNYSSTFIGLSSALPLTFNEIQTYTAKAYYFGYLAQLEYQLNKKWSVGVNYSYSNANDLIFKNSANDTFAVSKNSNQNNFGTSLAYRF